MSKDRQSRYPQYEVDMTPVYTGLQSQKTAADAARAEAARVAQEAETQRLAAEAEAAKKVSEEAK